MIEDIVDFIRREDRPSVAAFNEEMEMLGCARMPNMPIINYGPQE
jgi:hypothetical protein